MGIIRNILQISYAATLYFFLYRKLIDTKFDTYGKKISLLFLLKKRIKIFINLFCNPVSIVRYFEFPFAYENANWKGSLKYLDVSSPRLFFLYVLTQNSNIELDAINPDNKDLDETKLFLQTLDLPNKINLNSYDVMKLPYPDQHFDIITSISVIEHIPDRGDTLAMQEMWRVLKSGGKLVITVPCKKKSEDEWRERNIYGLVNEKQGNKYFFQRFYDNNTLIERLFSAIAIEPVVKEFFGEKQDKIFSEYEQRWIRDGLKETVKDPLHIVRDYQKFSTVDDLPGMGVCGLVFEKP